MRRLMGRLGVLVGAGLLTMSNTGCILNMYSPDPNDRMQEMLSRCSSSQKTCGKFARNGDASGLPTCLRT